jgi:hypothetical protein
VVEIAWFEASASGSTPGTGAPDTHTQGGHMTQQSITVAETPEERWQQIPEDIRERVADSLARDVHKGMEKALRQVNSVRVAVLDAPELVEELRRDPRQVGKIDKLTAYLEHRRDEIQSLVTEVVQELRS